MLNIDLLTYYCPGSVGKGLDAEFFLQRNVKIYVLSVRPIGDFKIHLVFLIHSTRIL